LSANSFERISPRNENNILKRIMTKTINNVFVKFCKGIPRNMIPFTNEAICFCWKINPTAANNGNNNERINVVGKFFR